MSPQVCSAGRGLSATSWIPVPEQAETCVAGEKVWGPPSSTLSFYSPEKKGRGDEVIVVKNNGHRVSAVPTGQESSLPPCEGASPAWLHRQEGEASRSRGPAQGHTGCGWWRSGGDVGPELQHSPQGYWAQGDSRDHTPDPVSRTLLFSLSALWLGGWPAGLGLGEESPEAEPEGPKHPRGAWRPQPGCPSCRLPAPVKQGFGLLLIPKVERSLMNHS